MTRSGIGRFGALAVTSLVWAAAAGCQPALRLPAGPVEIDAPNEASVVVALPNLDDSLKFAVLGDFGTGDAGQYEMAEQIATTHLAFPFELVLLVGDNIYGSERPQDMRTKFEQPYRALLERDVRFYASLGNHDSRDQRYYAHFNMDGRLYYSFTAPRQNVRFFALESTYPEPEQIAWLERELQASTDDWKIVYMHHPLYSSGAFHGSDVQLRRAIEPLLLKYSVSVVFAGHDHVYERVNPQEGISHFVIGSGGKLRPGNINPTTGLTARGFDRDLTFFVAEIAGDELTFQAISRLGQIVDSGRITRRMAPGDAPEPPASSRWPDGSEPQ
jgi:hypothetical protein